MKNAILTGRTFPEQVFSKKFEKFILFEYDLLFNDDFITAFYLFCRNNNIQRVYLDSLDKHLPFEYSIELQEFKEDYTRFMTQMPIEKELPLQLTYYDLLNNFVLYGDGESFAFYADRDSNLGLLGIDKHLNMSNLKMLSLNMPLLEFFQRSRFNEKYYNLFIDDYQGKEIID